MFLLCVLYDKDKRQNAEQSGQRSTNKVQRENRKNPAAERGCVSLVLVVCSGRVNREGPIAGVGKSYCACVCVIVYYSVSLCVFVYHCVSSHATAPLYTYSGTGRRG